MRLILLALLALMLCVPGERTYAQAGDRERTAFVTAVDARDEPIVDLAPGDVLVREDGVRREVLRISRATEPMDIALLVDNSASAQRGITELREGLLRFVTAMTTGDNANAGHQIAVVGLADRPTILVDYTSDRRRLEDGIKRIFPMSTSGMTLLDALIETSRGLSRRNNVRAVIVPVIFDGVEFSNRYYRAVVDDIKEAGASLQVVGIGTFGETGDSVIRERELTLDAGTRETGGQRTSILVPMALPTTLERLARQLSSQLKIVYSRPQSLIPPEKVEISSARPGVTVRGTPMRGQPGA